MPDYCTMTLWHTHVSFWFLSEARSRIAMLSLDNMYDVCGWRRSEMLLQRYNCCPSGQCRQRVVRGAEILGEETSEMLSNDQDLALQ